MGAMAVFITILHASCTARFARQFPPASNLEDSLGMRKKQSDFDLVCRRGRAIDGDSDNAHMH